MKALKFARRTRLCLLGGTVLVLAAFIATRASTPQFRNPSGEELPAAVASLEKVEIGGTDQWLLIRGERQTNPVLLFLPGGPGLSLMPLAHKFQSRLEKDFVVVQWDQREAGKSYTLLRNPRIDEEHFISDTHDLIELLLARFHQPKIYLVGHSWGTYLGMLVAQRYPELIYAYIGVGQVSDSLEVAQVQAQFVTAQQHRQAPTDRNALHTAVAQLGGSLHGENSSLALAKEALRAEEYSYLDYLRLVGGLFYYLRHNPEIREAPSRVTKVNVPVYFFVGRYDYVTPAPLTFAYFNKIEAPQKRLVWFEDSAHWAFYEEPDKFAEELQRVRQEVETPPVPQRSAAVVQASDTGGAKLAFRCSAGNLEAYLETRPLPRQDYSNDYLTTVDVSFDGELPRHEIWSEWDDVGDSVFAPNAPRFASEAGQHQRLTLSYVPMGSSANNTVKFGLSGEFGQQLMHLVKTCR